MSYAMYSSFLVARIRLSSQERAFLREYRAILKEYRALLREYGALLREY